MAARRACSLEDSILDRMLDSRLLGLKTFAMGGHLLLTDWLYAFSIALYKKDIRANASKKKEDAELKIDVKGLRRKECPR
jgi:hypothetical protein